MSYESIIETDTTFESVKLVLDAIINIQNNPCNVKKQKEILKYLDEQMNGFKFDWKVNMIKIERNDIGITVRSPFDREETCTLGYMAGYISGDFADLINETTGLKIYAREFPYGSSALMGIVVVDKDVDVYNAWDEIWDEFL